LENTHLTHDQIITLTTRILRPGEKELIAELEANEENPDADVRGRTALGKEVRGFINTKAETGESPALVSDEDEALILSEPPRPAPVDVGRTDEVLEAIASAAPAEEGADYSVMVDGDNAVVVSYGQRELSEAQQTAIENEGRDRHVAERINRRMGRTMSEKFEFTEDVKLQPGEIERMLESFVKERGPDLARATDRLQTHLDEFRENWQRCERLALTLNKIMESLEVRSLKEFLSAVDADADSLKEAFPDLGKNDNLERLKNSFRARGISSLYNWTDHVFNALYNNWHRNGLLDVVQLTYLDEAVPVYDQDGLTPEGDAMQPLGWSPEMERRVEELVNEGKHVTLLLGGMHHPGVTRLLFEGKGFEHTKGSLIVAGAKKDRTGKSWLYHKPEHAVFASREGLSYPAGLVEGTLNNPFISRQLSETDRDRNELGMQLAEEETLGELDADWQDYSLDLANSVVRRLGGEEEITAAKITEAIAAAVGEDIGPARGPQVADRLTHRLDVEGKMVAFEKAVRTAVEAAEQNIDRDRQNAESEMAEMVVATIPPMPARRRRMLGRMAPSFGAAGMAATLALAFLGSAIMADQAVAGEEPGQMDMPDMSLDIQPEDTEIADEDAFLDIPVESILPVKPGEIADLPEARKKARVSPQRILETEEEKLAPEDRERLGAAVERIRDRQKGMLAKSGEALQVRPEYASVVRDYKMRLWRKRYITDMEKDRAKAEAEEGLDVTRAQQDLAISLARYIDAVSGEISPVEGVPMHLRKEAAWQDVVDAIEGCFVQEEAYWQKLIEIEEDRLEVTQRGFRKGLIPHTHLKNQRMLVAGTKGRLGQIGLMREIYMELAKLDAPMLLFQIIEGFPIVNSIWDALPPVVGKSDVPRSEQLAAVQRIKNSLKQILDIEAIIIQNDIESGRMYLEWGEKMYGKRYRSDAWIKLERQGQEKRERVGEARIALMEEQKRAMDDLELAEALDMPIFRQLGEQALSAEKHADLMQDFFERSERLYNRFPLYGKGDYLVAKFNAQQSEIRAHSTEILTQMAEHYKALGFPISLPETGKFVRGTVDAQQTMPDEATPLPRRLTREEIEYHTGEIKRLHKDFMDLSMAKFSLWADWNAEVGEFYLNYKYASEGQKDDAVWLLNLAKYQRLETDLLDGERRLLDLEEGTPEYDRAVKAYEDTVMALLHERLRFVNERIPHMEKRETGLRKAGIEDPSKFYGSEKEGLELVRDMIEMQIEWFETLRSIRAPVVHPDFAPRAVISVQEIQKLTERLLTGKPRAENVGWVTYIDENDEERLVRIVTPGKIAMGNVVYSKGFGRFGENVIYIQGEKGVAPAESVAMVHCDIAGFLPSDDPGSITYAYVALGGPALRLQMSSGDYMLMGLKGTFTMDPQPILVGVDPKSPEDKPKFLVANVLYEMKAMEIDLRDGRTVKAYRLFPKKVIVRSASDTRGTEGLSTLGLAEDNMPIVAQALNISEDDPLQVETAEGWKELSITPVDALHPERIRRVEIKDLSAGETRKSAAARARKTIAELAQTNRHIDSSQLNEFADSNPHMALSIAEGLRRTFNSVDAEVMRMIPDQAVPSPETLEEIAATGRMPAGSRIEVTVRDKYVDVALTTPAVSRSVPVRRSGDEKLDGVSLRDACGKIGDALNAYAMSVETNAFNRCYANSLEIRTSGVKMDDPDAGRRAMKAVRKGIDAVNQADRDIIGNTALGRGTRKIDVYERDGAVKVHIEGVTKRDDPISIAADDPDKLEDTLWREVAAAHVKFSLLSNTEKRAWGHMLIAGEVADAEQQFRDALRLHLGINPLVSEEERPKYSAQLRYMASLLGDGREGLRQRQGMAINQGVANAKSNASTIAKLAVAAGLIVPVIGFVYNALIGDGRARRRRRRQETQSLDSFKGYDLDVLERTFFKGRDFGLDGSLTHPASRIRFTSQSRFGDTYDVRATLTPAVKNVPESLRDRAGNVPFDSLEGAIAIRDRLRREKGFAVKDTGIVEVDTTYGPQHMARVRIDGKWQYLTLAPVRPQVSGDRITPLTDDQAEDLRESRRRDGTVISGDQQILSCKREEDELSLKRTVVTTFSVDVAREDSSKAQIQPDDEIVLTLHNHLVTDGWKKDRKLVFRRSAREIAGILAMPKTQQRTRVARYLTEQDIGLSDITAEDETALNRAVTEQADSVADLLAKIDLPESIQPVVRRAARPKGQWLDKGGVKFNAKGQTTPNVPEAAGEKLRQIVEKLRDAVTGIGNDEKFVRRALRSVNVRIFEGLDSPAELSGSERNNILRLDSRLFTGLGDTEVRFILRHIIAPALAGMRGEKELLEKQFPSAPTLTSTQRDRIERWARKIAGEEWPAAFTAELGRQLASAEVAAPAETRRAVKTEETEVIPVTLRRDTAALWEEEMTIEEVIKNTEELFREGEMLERFSQQENEGLKEKLDQYLAVLKTLPSGVPVGAVLDGADEDTTEALHQINDEFLWYARKIGKVEVLGVEDPRVTRAIEYYETVTEGMNIDVAREIRRLAEQGKLSAVARIKGIPIRGHASEKYGINIITEGTSDEEAEDITALVHEIGVMLGLEHELNQDLENVCVEFLEGPLAGGTITYLQGQLEDAETGVKLAPDGRVAMIDTVEELKRVDRAHTAQITPLWLRADVREKGIEAFRGPLSDEQFTALRDATTFVERALVLSRALGLSDRAFSRLVEGTDKLASNWLSKKIELPSLANVTNTCNILRVDPLFLLEGAHDIEEAMQRRTPNDRVRLAMRIEGVTLTEMARRFGVSRATISYILAGELSPARREFFYFARALNQGQPQRRWSPVLLEFGMQPPAYSMFARPAGKTRFMLGGGSPRQEMLERAEALADAIVEVWRTEAQHRPNVINAWSSRIRPFDCPHRDSPYPSVTGALLGFGTGALDQARHYGLINQEIMDWLLRWRQDPSAPWLRSRSSGGELLVVQLAHRLADAHEEIEELFTLQERYLPPLPKGQHGPARLRPPDGYVKTAAVMDDGAWFWLSRLIPRSRALTILNNLPENYHAFKNLLGVSNPEGTIEGNRREIARLVVLENGVPDNEYHFTQGAIASAVWGNRNPQPVLRKKRVLLGRLLDPAEHRWTQPVDSSGALCTPATFLGALSFGGVPQLRSTVLPVENRSAVFRHALLRSPHTRFTERIAGIQGLTQSPEISTSGPQQQGLAEAHDLLNRVFGWVQYLAPPQHPFVSCLRRTPVRDNHDLQVAYLGVENGPNDFLAAVREHMPADVTQVEDVDAFARTIADAIIAATPTYRKDTTALWEEGLTVEDVVTNATLLMAQKSMDSRAETALGYIEKIRQLPDSTPMERVLEGEFDESVPGISEALHQLNDEFQYYFHRTGRAVKLDGRNARVRRAKRFLVDILGKSKVADEIDRLLREGKISTIPARTGKFRVPIRGHASAKYGINITTSGDPADIDEETAALIHEIGVMLGFEHEVNHRIERLYMDVASRFREYNTAHPRQRAKRTLLELEEWGEDALLRRVGDTLGDFSNNMLYDTATGRVAMIDIGEDAVTGRGEYIEGRFMLQKEKVERKDVAVGLRLPDSVRRVRAALLNARLKRVPRITRETVQGRSGQEYMAVFKEDADGMECSIGVKAADGEDAGFIAANILLPGDDMHVWFNSQLEPGFMGDGIGTPVNARMGRMMLRRFPDGYRLRSAIENVETRAAVSLALARKIIAGTEEHGSNQQLMGAAEAFLREYDQRSKAGEFASLQRVVEESNFDLVIDGFLEQIGPFRKSHPSLLSLDNQELRALRNAFDESRGLPTMVRMYEVRGTDMESLVLTFDENKDIILDGIVTAESSLAAEQAEAQRVATATEEPGRPAPKRRDLGAVSRAREFGRAVGEWWQGTDPLRGAAEGYYDINRLDERGLRTALRSAEINAAFAEAGTKPLTAQQIDFHAPRLIERRPALRGYRSDAEIGQAMRRKKREDAIPKQAKLTSKQAEIIAGFFQRGFTRRTVVGGFALGAVAVGAATTVAVMSSGEKEAERPVPAAGEGEIAVCLGYHGEKADAAKVLAELRATEGAKKRIFFGETGSYKLWDLKKNHPEMAKKITAERLYQLISLLKERDDLWLLNWSRGDEGDPELRELARDLIDIQYGPQAILDSEGLIEGLRENPALLKKLDGVSMGGFLKSILQYAVDNEDIEVVFEKAPLKSFLYYLLSELTQSSAHRKLYASGDEVGFARNLVASEAGRHVGDESRETAYTGLLSEHLGRGENKGARAVVQMGAYHKTMVERIKGIPGFKVREAEAQRQFTPWMMFYDRHADELLEAETDDDYRALLNRNRREFLGFFVHQAIFAAFSGLRIGTALEIERTDEAFAGLTVEDLEKITALLQEKSKIIDESGLISEAEWNTLLGWYVVAWIHDNKKELSKRVRGRMAKGYRDVTIEAMDAQVKRLVSERGVSATEVGLPLVSSPRTIGPTAVAVALAAIIGADGADGEGEKARRAQVVSRIEQRMEETFKPEDYGYYGMLKDPRSRITFSYSEATNRLEMVLQCERQLNENGLYEGPAGYNCLDGVRNVARWARDEGVACGVRGLEMPDGGIHYYVEAADGTQFNPTPDYARVGAGFTGGVAVPDEAVEARFRLHAEGIELFRQRHRGRGHPESDVFMGWSPLRDGGSLTRNANVFVNYGGNEARLVFRHRLSCVVNGQDIGGRVFEVLIPASRLAEVQEALRAIGPDEITEERLATVEGLGLEVRGGPTNRALEAVWPQVETESERTIDTLYHLITSVDTEVVPVLEEQFARVEHDRSEAEIETRRPRIVIPAFENRARLAQIVSEAVQARSYPLSVEVVTDHDTTDGAAITQALSEQGNRLNLLIDTDDEAVVAEMIGPLLDELDVNMLLLQHPGLRVNRGSAVTREALTQLTQDRRLHTVIRSGEAAYALSRAIRMELSGCGQFAYYAYSERVRALSQDSRRMMVLPSSVLEGNIERGIRASIASRQMQMGGIEGEDPISDVLVITNPNIVSELQVTNYLATLELGSLFDRNRVITHQQIAQRCPDKEIGNLTELELKAIINQIMEERGLEVADETDMDILGGTEGLVSMLIQGILTGIEPGQEVSYEEAIERLVNNGELDPKVAQQLNESKDLLIKPTEPEYETYRSELQNLKQRLNEAIATDFSA